MPRYRCVTCGHEFSGGPPITFGSFEPGSATPPCPKGPIIGVSSDEWHVVTLAAQIAETPKPPVVVPGPVTVVAPVIKPLPIRPPKENSTQQEARKLIQNIWNLIRSGGEGSYKANRREYEYGVSRACSDPVVRAAIQIWLGYNGAPPTSADEVQRAFYDFHIPGWRAGGAASWAGSAKNDGSEARKGNVQTNFVCLRNERGVVRRHNVHVTHRSSFAKTG